jgi:V8-like Glu-specific endopeptidase
LVIGEHLRDVVLETPHPYPPGDDVSTGPVWSDYFYYPGAEYLVFEFTQFGLAPGDWVEVRDPLGRGFKDKGGDFISKMILGPEAIIDLYSKNADHEYYGYRIERVTRGFNRAELEMRYEDGRATRAICGTDDKEDAVCYENDFPDVYEEARAVARIVMDGSSLCTAWLVSCENHVLTNNHCTWDDDDFDTQGELDRMEFQFMYEDAFCGGGGANFEYSFMGGTWLENHHNLDYTLIQAPAGEDPASTYGWLLIDNRLVDIDETIYIVGHPSGRPKEISLYSTDPTDQDNPDGFCEVFSQDEPVCVGGTVGEIGYYCDTEGGSSGSPVLSRITNKVVALHHCANCPNRGVRIQNVWETNQAGPNALPRRHSRPGVQLCHRREQPTRVPQHGHPDPDPGQYDLHQRDHGHRHRDGPRRRRPAQYHPHLRWRSGDFSDRPRGNAGRADQRQWRHRRELHRHDLR